MKWFFAGGAAVITALVCFALHSIDVSRIEAKHEKALKLQAASINSQCTIAKAITTGVSHDLQSNLSVLDSDYAWTFGLLDSTRCQERASVDASAAGRYDATPAGQEFAERVERAFEPKRVTDIVRKGERYRVQLLACQSYVKQVVEISAQQK